MGLHGHHPRKGGSLVPPAEVNMSSSDVTLTPSGIEVKLVGMLMAAKVPTGARSTGKP